MNSIWNNNCRLLQDRFPELYNLLLPEIKSYKPDISGGNSTDAACIPFAESDSPAKTACRIAAIPSDGAVQSLQSLSAGLQPENHQICPDGSTMVVVSPEPDAVATEGSGYPLMVSCGWKLYPAKNGQITGDYQGIMLHSAYNPSREAQKLAAEVKEQAAAGKISGAVVFLGFSLGYEPVEVAAACPDLPMVLVEPDSVCFVSALRYVDFSPVFLSKECILLVGAPVQTVVTLLNYYGCNRCRIIKNKPAAARQPAYFSELDILIARNRSKDEINSRTLDKFSRLWQRNSCHNLCQIAKRDGVARYVGTAEKLSACVVAAGPSLDNILPHLAEIKKRCLLICVDTALRACLRVGVQPDFIVLVDPQYWNIRHLDNCAAPDSVLITELAAYPAVFRFRCREIVLCSSLYPVGAYFERICGTKGALGAGGSVASTAWDFARLCGCREIFIAGLDLGFPDGRTHAKGSTFEEQSHINSSRTAPAETAAVRALLAADMELVEDYTGSSLVSDSRMALYAWWFESMVAADSFRKTFSVTAGSRRIPGIGLYPVSQLLQRSESVQERQEFFCKEAEFRKQFSGRAEEYAKKYMTAAGSLIDALQQIKSAAMEGIRYCRRALSVAATDCFSQAFAATTAELSKIDALISGNSGTAVASLVFPSEKHLQELCVAAGIPADPRLASLQKSEIIYGELVSAVDGYLVLLREHTAGAETVPVSPDGSAG